MFDRVLNTPLITLQQLTFMCINCIAREMIPSKDNTVFTGGGKMGFEVVEILCFVEVNFDIL